jgi:tetratricopeptide (TPR) repeat protein
LPAGLTQSEREFFLELRRLAIVADLSYRKLEELTSSFRPKTDDPAFYSKSQWGRWVNGQAMPPRNAIRKLAGILAAADVDASQLLELWSRAIASAAEDARPDTDRGPVAPAGTLVGREGQLALLAGLVDQMVQGRGGAVLIEGEPGIGKSALAGAAVAHAARAGCQAFWGTGDELGQALPLLPFLDGLRVREPSTNPRRNTIVGLLRGEVQSSRGADVPAVLAEQLLALIAEQCAVRPVILVVDDLQWADQASIALWGRLARSARQLRLLLVGLMRPVPQREELLALRRAVASDARIQLGGLAGAAVADLVAALAGGPPDEGLLRLAAEAAGNPLYVTELIAALIRSSGVVLSETGTATLTAISAPQSLTAAIADRLGFMAGPVREMLRAAALLGVDFAVPDLAVVLGRAVMDLIPLVDEACAMGVLAGSGPALRFRHPLIWAALYDDIPAPVRAAWHHDAARALAEADLPPDRVARQLLQAIGEPGGRPAAAGTEPVSEWILAWLARTADLLVGRAPGVAVDLLDRAVANTPAGLRHDRLAARQADALYRVGDIAQAERVATRALAHGTEPDVVVDLHWTLAQCRMLAGSAAESLATLDEALASPGILARHRARLLVLTARTHLYIGAVEEAGRVATGALEAATEAADNWSMAWALHVLAIMTGVQGHPADTLPLFDRALAVTQADAGLSDLRLLLQINQAVALAGLDRYDEALAAAGQARQLADHVGTARRRTQAHSVLGQLLFETGRWDDALAEVTAMDEDLKEPTAACCDLGIAAVICFHRGEVAEARQHLTATAPYALLLGRRLIGPLALARSLDREQDAALPEALAALTDAFHGDTEELEEVENLLADAVRLATKTGDLASARAFEQQAATLADGSRIPHREADALYCRALLDSDASRLLAAAERYDDASRPLQKAKALEAAAKEFAHAGHRDQARTAFTRAVKTYASLGAAADIAQLQSASS